ncbi:uncharacterized protein METZ01_LOCUS310904 [marine metagenome]|uniref:VacJ family lipoprotein n=1 Tax=marine metagenome TaxID=408172 RepID=A0A382NBE2_9ZZZZ
MRRKGISVVSVIPRLYLAVCVLLLGAMVLVGCSSAPKNDPEALAEFQKINDPMEVTNRGIFSFNQVLDKVVVKPVTGVYRSLIPSFMRKAVHRFLQNLRTPVTLANDLLQGEGGRAGDTVARFFINSTIGLLGFMDPASHMGFAQHEEDFGQTLAVWGVGEGPYLMLPVFGPSNPRDLTGKVVGFFLDPLNMWAANTDRNEIPIIRTIVSGIDARDLYWDALEDIEKNSIDPYASIRSLYRQRRNDEIRNGKEGPSTSLPDLGRGFELAKSNTTK